MTSTELAPTLRQSAAVGGVVRRRGSHREEPRNCGAADGSRGCGCSTAIQSCAGWQLNCHPNRGLNCRPNKTLNSRPNQRPCNASRSSADCSVPGYCSARASSKPPYRTCRSKTASISWKRKPPSPIDRRCVIRGDRLDAVDVSTSAIVTVTGRPARFEARGLGLTGTNIHLNRGANRLWIDGPGRMDVPLSAAVQGQASAGPGMLTVDWQRRMDFDGRTAQFEEGVVAMLRQLQSDGKTVEAQLKAAAMQAQLQQAVNFSQSDAQGARQVERIQCLGGVSMTQRSFDPRQQLTAHDRMEVTDLAVNILTGELSGGPGWLNSVRLGLDNPLGNAAPGRRAPPNPTQVPSRAIPKIHFRPRAGQQGIAPPIDVRRPGANDLRDG